MIKEFKEFISQGSALDLAIGIILGAAFGAVVSSLVDDVLMQLIGAIVGQPSFDAINIHWGDKLVGDARVGVLTDHPGLKEAYEKQIFIGSFITAIINFLIIAFVIFMIVKVVNRMRKPKEVVVVDERGDHGTERRAEDDADRQIECAPLGDELLELFDHERCPLFPRRG